MSDLLKITKIKIKIVISFLILSFLFSLFFNILNRTLFESSISEEELIFLSQYILPVPYFLLTILKFYLFACLAIYFINKDSKR